MAFEYSRLVDVTTIAASAASIYANPASTTSYVRLINIHNSNTTAETVILYQVPDSGGSLGTAGDTNIIFEEELAADATRIIEYAVPGLMLVDENDSIQGETTTASKVTITITGATE